MVGGFSLIEILTIIAILAILVAVPMVAFRLFQETINLNNAQDEIMSVLNLAKSMTMASEGASQYGVYFDRENNRFNLFKGASWAQKDPAFNREFKLPDLVKIDSDSLGEVVFDKITGKTSQVGSVILYLESRPEKTKTIYVLSSGRVVTEIPQALETQRKKDSRHVHFNLRWSIQNATDLKFKFIGPEPDEIKSVEMANYFNGDKTEFNWSGSFTVDGITQEFKVHTHLLDSGNTALCIHRDRNQNKNSEEVLIFITDSGVDKEIAHYYADENATVEKGEIHVFSREIQ